MSTDSKQSLLTDQYDVVWVSAIGKEFLIASYMLDELYNNPPDLPDDDENAYVFGRIGAHNVVLASLPEGSIGVEQAGRIAADVVRSFKRLRFGLMVGIAGGAPSTSHDIRLGDVVVSRPNDKKQLGGVVHYGFGASLQDSGFQRRGSLNSPPRILLSAITSLRREHGQHGQNLRQAVELLISQHAPRLNDYVRPDDSLDRLMQPTVLHPHGLNECDISCFGDKQNLVARDSRPAEEQICVHYGVVASASTLMRNALLRDKITEQDEVLCFEMESAGLMNADLGWLVVRGICDYSDTHKNDVWQNFAAAVAALYAKELLGVVRPRSTDTDSRDRTFHHRQKDIADNIIDILEILRFNDMNTKEKASMPDTLYNLDWVWSTPIDAWLRSSENLFWVCGKPASGKSTLMAHLAHHKKTIEHLQSMDTNFHILHFFYDFRAGSFLANNISGMLRAFLYQLARDFSAIKTRLKTLVAAEELDLDSGQYLLDLTCDALNVKDLRVCAFIDGLDEYEGDLVVLASTLKLLLDRTGIKLCLASRPEFDVATSIKPCKTIVMQHHNVSSMQEYAKNKVLQCSLKVPTRSAETDLIPATEKLIQEAEGVILWFRLAFDEVVDSYRDGKTLDEVLAVVDSMPAGLDHLFERILNNIDPAHKGEAALMLHLFEESSKLYSARPKISDMDTEFLKPRIEELNTLDHLYTLYDYVAERLGSETRIQRYPGYSQFRHCINLILRGLLEVIPGHHTYPLYHSEMVVGRHLAHRSGCGIRYIHKTFYAFLAKTDWIPVNLPVPFCKRFPDWSLLRLAIDVLYSFVNECDSGQGVHIIAEKLIQGVEHYISNHRGDRVTRAKWIMYEYREPLVSYLAKLWFYSNHHHFRPESNSWYRHWFWDLKIDDFTWNSRQFDTQQAELCRQAPLLMQSRWLRRYRLMRTCAQHLPALTRAYETTGESSYTVLAPLLNKRLSSMLMIWYPQFWFMRNVGLKHVKSVLKNEFTEEFGGLVIAAHMMFTGYVGERLQQISMSPDQKQYLRWIFMLKLSTMHQVLATRSNEILAILNSLSDQWDSRDVCMLMKTANCSEQAAACARVLLSNMSRCKGPSSQHQHHDACKFRGSSNDLISDWVMKYGSECADLSHRHTAGNALVLLNLCRKLGTDINLPCLDNKTALQHLCGFKLMNNIDYAKFQALLLAGVDPGDVKGQKKLLHDLSKDKKKKMSRFEGREYERDVIYAHRVTAMKQSIEYHIKHGKWPQVLWDGEDVDGFKVWSAQIA